MTKGRRRALVTGGGVRVGRAIVLGLAEAGLDVAVHYGRSDEAADATAARARAYGVRSRALQADLRDTDEIDDLFQAVEDELGGLDLLVNSAAIFPRTPPEEVDAEDWDEVFATNARAPFFCSVRARELMTDAAGDAGRRSERHGERPTSHDDAGADGTPGPSIVNIADVGAFEGWPSHAPYAASKAALVSLTRSLARAWAPRVRVNAVAPGPVLLPPGSDVEDRRRADASTALGRVGRPEDVADAVLFLAGARFTTGEVVRVDGGYHLLTGGSRRE